MYELIRLSEHDYYIDCPAKIGLSRIDDAKVVLIDGGSDKDAAKKALRHIENNGWQLTAVYNTHSHADHIGGNRLLEERTGCRIYARGIEAICANYPQLEGMTLYGGLPLPELRGKFLLAQPSGALPLTAADLPEGWELVELPGHCFDMVGFRTADGNLFLGDCLSSEETLAKYGVGFLWDPGTAIRTLEEVKTMTAPHFVPAHAPVTEEIAPLAQVNIDAIRAISAKVLSFCETPSTFETILARLFSDYRLTMNARQYALIGCTLRGYLTDLLTEGKISYTFDDNRMLWHKTAEA